MAPLEADRNVSEITPINVPFPLSETRGSNLQIAGGAEAIPETLYLSPSFEKMF